MCKKRLSDDKGYYDWHFCLILIDFLVLKRVGLKGMGRSQNAKKYDRVKGRTDSLTESGEAEEHLNKWGESTQILNIRQELEQKEERLKKMGMTGVSKKIASLTRRLFFDFACVAFN